MQYKSFVFITCLMLPLFLGVGVGSCRTNAMRATCGNCHTMHNSLDNSPMTVGSLPIQEGLLKSNCYGCHAGTNTFGSTPYVFPGSAGAPNYGTTGTDGGHDTLAGGSFYWASTGGQDKMGHNVKYLTTPTVGAAPGGNPALIFGDTPDHELTCAGTWGCHGDRSVASEVDSMYGTHHADDSLPTDGSTLGQSFRFLQGVAGIEDQDYEFNVSAGDHNQYNGLARGAEGDPDPYGGSMRTMSHFCAECHGDFHSNVSGNADAGVAGGAWGSPWIRHPVDYDMNGSTDPEYQDYGGALVNAYVVETPLASALTPAEIALGTASIKSSVLAVPGDAIITCVSCHRAHGSKYEYGLRWNYKDWPGTGGYNGCGDCHTYKN